MGLIYKTLFEVKLLHEFYVTNTDGNSIFDLANQNDRLNFLLDQYRKDEESINQDVLFEFPKQLQLQYEMYNLKVLPTFSGCKVVVRVNQKTLSDNTLVYTPVIPLADDLNICIAIVKKDNRADSYSHSSIARPFSSVFFFSNNNIPGVKSFPFLTNNISDFSSGTAYAQGDLASFGANDIREYYKDAAGDQWNPVAGSAFANENDRLLVPSTFQYSFYGNTNVTNANFVLKDNNGNIIKEISLSNPNNISSVTTDFSDKADTISVSDTLTADKVFALEISGNNYSKNYKVIFSDTLYTKENWGVINIKIKPENPSFNLFASDGFLIKRKSPLGVFTEAPVFEIPVKSAFVYWRYLNDKGKELKLIPDLTDYLFKEDNILLTKKPRALTRYYFLLNKEGSADTKYVPNPLSYDLKKDSKDRICCDVPVPDSDLFPVV
jgi:hypothetical protein